MAEATDGLNWDLDNYNGTPINENNTGDEAIAMQELRFLTGTMTTNQVARITGMLRLRYSSI